MIFDLHIMGLQTHDAHQGGTHMVSTLVRYCKGKVGYWQMDNEPHNPSFWHGSAADYVDQLKVFYRTVKEAAPESFVILAGAAGISNPTLADLPMKQAEREFFAHLMREGADYYDVFDLHLYGDPYIIPTEIEGLREMMAALGYQKPIFAGEYNGPLFFLFKENLPYVSLMGQVMSAIGTEDAQEQSRQEEAEHIFMAELYARMDSGVERCEYGRQRAGSAIHPRPQDAAIYGDLAEHTVEAAEHSADAGLREGLG